MNRQAMGHRPAPTFTGLVSFLRRWLIPCTASLLLAGCGGAGGPTADTGGASAACAADAGTTSDCGSVLIAVTDADGDFVSYTVDVLSITLLRANGSTVEALPAAARVDFAELTELAELLSVATLAPGEIVGGRIRIDYADAEIFVESGGDIVPAEVVDETGAALGVLELELRLPGREQLRITRARAALLNIDFDLAASHDVDLSATPARVLARPYLVAEVTPLDEKELRVRGALVEVDPAAGSYSLRLRPWHRRDGHFGPLTVYTTAATSFEIGDESLLGTDGLAALAVQPVGTLTVAFGTLDLATRRFTAEIVHAADSVGGIDYAAVHGHVVARSGDRLTVRGALAVHRDRPARFRRTVHINIGPDTHVTRVGSPGGVQDTAAISVGQRIVALGQFTNAEPASEDAADTGTTLVLDATEGRVRLLVTRLHGMVSGILPGQLNLALRAIDRLNVALFDFSGTGTSVATDADPADYEIATATLSLSGFEVGRPARVLGFATPFGAAPPDFEGRGVVGPGDIPAALGIGWKPDGTLAPFVSMSADGLVPDLANPQIGTRHHLLLGPMLVDLFDLPAAPQVSPSPLRGLYGIATPGHIELFADFPAYVDELSRRLGAGQAARSFAAYGPYDETEGRLTARRIVTHLEAAP